MRTLAVLLGLALALVVLYVQSVAVQVLHDSCRYWREPPTWSVLCPPSTRHGVQR